MPTLQFEHPIRDYDMWKAAFDSDPIDRPGLGVRSHRIYRPVDDPHYIVGELEFETHEQADVCAAKLRELWSSGRAAPALRGEPKVRIVDTVENHHYP